MAQQTINIGSAPNDGTGDTIRDGGDKINDNFTELYAADAALDTRIDALEAGGGIAVEEDGSSEGTGITTLNFSTGLSVAVAGTEATITADATAPTESIILAPSDETTALTAGTGKLTFRMPYAFTLTAVRASVNTAPTGSTLIVDINESGSSILSTKLSIDASEKTSTTAASAAVISDSALADDAEISIDIDQVGSTIAGAGLKVVLIGHQ